MQSEPNPVELFLELLCEPETLHELRILASNGVFGGYYDDSGRLCEDAIAKSGTGNVYLTLNPVEASCVKESRNRIDRLGSGEATKDNDIVKRTTVLLDFDPVRPTGTPSTDAEHEAALGLAQTVETHLGTLGWPAPIATDSGNGAALLYRVDLPVDDGGLVRRVLESLAQQFNTDEVHIDSIVHNPARITRMPGTLNMKGVSTAERPHRLAKVVRLPETFVAVSREQLAALTPATDSVPKKNGLQAPAFDVETWLTDKKIGFKKKAGACHDLKGTWYTLDYCPFKGPSHTDGNSGIFAADDGRLFGCCHHDKCKDKSWRDFRLQIDPEFDTRNRQLFTGGILEDVRDSYRLARVVLEHFDHPERCKLMLCRGLLYKWEDVWQTADEDSLRLRIWRVVKAEFDCYARAMAAKGAPVKVPNVDTRLVNNVLGALRSLVEANADFGEWLRGDGPPVGDLLVCKNGILNLRDYVSGEKPLLMPHTPRLFVTSKCDIDFDPSAPTPTRWLTFLDEVWPEDQESRKLLQQFFGYALTTDVSHQKYLMLLGATRGGKGVITRLLTALVGSTNTCSIRLKNLADRFSLAGAVGKSLLLIPDALTPPGNRAHEVAETLRAVTGGDALDIDRKHLPSLSTALPVKVVMTSNEMLNLQDNSKALFERMCVLLFKNSFAKNPDPSLDAKLRRELPGILLWAIEGWRSLSQESKFVEPEASKGLKNSLQEAASPIRAFSAECCLVDSRAKADKDEMFAKWIAWCTANEEDPGKKSVFSRVLFAAHPQIRNIRRTIDGKRVWLYSGIALKEPNADADKSELSDDGFATGEDSDFGRVAV